MWQLASPRHPLFFLFLLHGALFAQSTRPVMVFGNVTPEVFTPTAYALDSSADAVFLFDKGRVYFDGSDNNRGFSIVFEKHARIRLLHKNAFGLATLNLTTFRKTGSGPVIDEIKGAVYNLEGGKVVVTKVDKSNIFTQQDHDYNTEKIAFPDIKEGSVMEYVFRVIYPGFSYLPMWYFQGNYPELWSEYDISVPELVDYVMERQGYQHFVLDTTIVSTASIPINISANSFLPAIHSSWYGRVVERTWAAADVPPIVMSRREPYTTTLKNYISKIEFQLSALHFPTYDKTIRSNWDELTDELMKSESFGTPLTDRNHWMEEELKKITGTGKTASPSGSGTTASLSTAGLLFAYVRDNFKCTNQEGIYLSQPFRKTWEDKKGNVADINLLLTAIYRHMGYTADPVILSSREHGVALNIYPLLKDYNYVITRVRIGEEDYLLDASKPFLGFGQLPELCYNGSARVIGPGHDLIPLSPDGQKEIRTTLVNLSNTDSGYTGTFYHTAGNFESMAIRNRMKTMSTEEYFDGYRKTMADYKKMTEHGFDTLSNYDQPVIWHYSMKYNFRSNRFYLNPIMHERLSTNPFSAPERNYPVEMPYCSDYTYVLNMEIPKGYEVEELPKSKRILLSDSTGIFEYLVESDPKNIHMRYHLVFTKTTYAVEDYNALRDFYARIVSKEHEEIIFKKAK